MLDISKLVSQPKNSVEAITAVILIDLNRFMVKILFYKSQMEQKQRRKYL